MFYFGDFFLFRRFCFFLEAFYFGYSYLQWVIFTFIRLGYGLLCMFCSGYLCFLLLCLICFGVSCIIRFTLMICALGLVCFFLLVALYVFKRWNLLIIYSCIMFMLRVFGIALDQFLKWIWISLVLFHRFWLIFYVFVVVLKFILCSMLR